MAKLTHATFAPLANAQMPVVPPEDEVLPLLELLLLELLDDPEAPDELLDELLSPDAPLEELAAPDELLEELLTPDAPLEELAAPDELLEELVSPDVPLDELDSPDGPLDELDSPDGPLDAVEVVVPDEGLVLVGEDVSVVDVRPPLDEELPLDVTPTTPLLLDVPVWLDAPLPPDATLPPLSQAADASRATIAGAQYALTNRRRSPSRLRRKVDVRNDVLRWPGHAFMLIISRCEAWRAVRHQLV